jgi:hypothetical protein
MWGMIKKNACVLYTYHPSSQMSLGLPREIDDGVSSHLTRTSEGMKNQS